MTADAGYERLGNYLFLEANGQMSFIKPANHEQRKHRKFKKQIGRMENMTYDADEDCFLCTQGRRPPAQRVRNCRNGLLSQQPGTAARTAGVVRSGPNAARQKTRSSQRNSG